MGKEPAYFVAAVLSGVVWSLLVYFCASPSAPPLAMFLLAGGGTGLVVSYLFRPVLRRSRLPWSLFLPLATVTIGTFVFAAFAWVYRFGVGGPRSRYFEVLSDLSLGLLFFYPMIYSLSFLNQWILHLVLVEHGAYRAPTRVVQLFLVGATLFWIVLLLSTFAPRAARPSQGHSLKSPVSLSGASVQANNEVNLTKRDGLILRKASLGRPH